MHQTGRECLRQARRRDGDAPRSRCRRVPRATRSDTIVPSTTAAGEVATSRRPPRACARRRTGSTAPRRGSSSTAPAPPAARDVDHEVEDPVVLGPSPGCDRRPQNGETRGGVASRVPVRPAERSRAKAAGGRPSRGGRSPSRRRRDRSAARAGRRRAVGPRRRPSRRPPVPTPLPWRARAARHAARAGRLAASCISPDYARLSGLGLRRDQAERVEQLDGRLPAAGRVLLEPPQDRRLELASAGRCGFRLRGAPGDSCRCAVMDGARACHPRPAGGR